MVPIPISISTKNKNIAESGHKTMTQAVESLQRISNSSDKIAEIINPIFLEFTNKNKFSLTFQNFQK